MPIVINEFEILPEAPGTAPTPAAAEPPAAPATVGPEEILRALARQRARLARVAAD